MASQLHQYQTKCSQGSVVMVPLKISPNGTGTPTIADNGGYATVARSDTGKFTITLLARHYSIVAATFGLSVVGDSTDLYPQGGVQTATTVVVKLKTGTANTDIAADADTHLDVVLWLKTADTRT